VSVALLLGPARWPAALKCTFVLLAMLVAPVLACAHAFVVDSVPRNGAALSAAPRQIELRFNVRVEQALTRAALVSHKGAPVPLTILPASESRSERVLIAVPSLGAGDYEVRYRVLATDGHATQGVLQFRVYP
jgi:methionine-rich copper-binding protein CopC